MIILDRLLDHISSMGKYDSRTVANSFLALASKNSKVLTHMQLQKLVYLAHGWSLAIDNALVVDDVQAWRYGPVFPILYSAFQKFGSEPISSLYLNYSDKAPLVQDEDDLDLLSAVLDGYGHFTGPQLSTLTHKSGSPWHQVYKEGKSGLTIPNRIIKNYFRGLKKTAQQDSALHNS